MYNDIIGEAMQRYVMFHWDGDWIWLGVGVVWWGGLKRKVWPEMDRRPHQLGPQTQSQVTTGPSTTPTKLTQRSSDRCSWIRKSDHLLHHHHPRDARRANWLSYANAIFIWSIYLFISLSCKEKMFWKLSPFIGNFKARYEL